MEKQQTQDVKTPPSRRRFVGIHWAIAFAVMNLLAGLNNLQDGNAGQASDYFVGASIILVGVFLYSLGKRHKKDSYFIGSKVLEAMLLGILIIFLLISFTNPLGNWYQSPLTWSITPIWALVAYLKLRFYDTIKSN